MYSEHLVTEETQEQAINEAKENGRDIDRIRDMYITPEEALGRVFKLTLYWGHTFAEAVAVNKEEEELHLEELFTSEKFVIPFGECLHVPFIGAEFSVSWVEAKADEKWERVSEYSTPHNIGSAQHPKEKAEQFDQTRVVEKTYEHKVDEFDTWPIRVDGQSGDAEIVPNPEDMENPDLLKQVLDSADLPNSFDLGRLEVGTVYTKAKTIETEDGPTKQYEIVWWSIKSQFEPSRSQRLSPVKQLA